MQLFRTALRKAGSEGYTGCCLSDLSGDVPEAVELFEPYLFQVFQPVLLIRLRMQFTCITMDLSDTFSEKFS